MPFSRRAPTADPNPRPDPVTVEWLAGEMQRRYYVGCMNLELMDFSDIMDRNEDTDLFFWDNQIAIDWMKFDLEDNFTRVTIEKAYVKQIVNETETEITADVYVFTPVRRRGYPSARRFRKQPNAAGRCSVRLCWFPCRMQEQMRTA